MSERWTRAVLRRRRLVVGAWLGVVVVGLVAAERLPDLASNTFAVPGTDSERARIVLERSFDERPDGTFTVVFPTPRPSDEAVQDGARDRLERAAALIPGSRAGELRTARGLIYGDIATTL